MAVSIFPSSFYLGKPVSLLLVLLCHHFSLFAEPGGRCDCVGNGRKAPCPLGSSAFLSSVCSLTKPQITHQKNTPVQTNQMLKITAVMVHRQDSSAITK